MLIRLLWSIPTADVFIVFLHVTDNYVIVKEPYFCVDTVLVPLGGHWELAL